MSVSTNAASSTQNLSSLILQELMSGSNAMATSGLSSSVLADVLSATGADSKTSTGQTGQTELPADITQALGKLLSGSDSADPSADLSTVQAYFKKNPSSLTSLLSSLQAGAGTYSADGTVSSSSSLLAALGITSTGGSSSSNASLISQLLSGGSQDPLLAALGGSSSSSSSSLSLLG
ncbi:MAG: hypothetical protein P4L36_19280 [Holophaga sp.]|nr:hypothetical protein [Holophaga sp.]